MNKLDSFLSSLTRRGVRLSIHAEELAYEAPAGVLTADDIGLIRQSKEHIVAALRSFGDSHEQRVFQARNKNEAHHPLSFAQERLWFIEQLGLAGPAYTIPAAYRLRGELDRTALQRAFKDLVARHESLRTRFISVQGQPQQVIDAAGEFECEELDLSGLESQAQAQEQEVQRLVQEDVQRPFDLAQGPLVRVSLLRLGEQEHVLQMTMHHIVSDGWSTGVLMRDVSALYAAHVKGKASGLEPLAIQYADFAVWQRQWLQGAILQEQLQYWKDRLSGAPAALELPTDHVRPAVASYKGGILPLELESELCAGLRELARQEGATLYMVLLAGFQVLLSRWSGQQDIVVGSPIAGRTQRELENLVGIFINTLLLRSRLQAGQSFRELLAQVKETALGAYAHQDLPFEKLVAELQPQRDLSRQPLCQVVFNLQNLAPSNLSIAGIALEGCEVAQHASKVDLELFLAESPDHLAGHFVFATDLFERSTIERMVGHFKTLLASAVADPTTAVSRLPLLGAQERRQLLEEWNATASPYPQERCLHEWISEQAARTPHAVALVCESQQLRYAQLEERSNQLGHYLRGLGVGPEVIVGLCVERSVEMVVGLLGILKAGGAYLPLDPGYPAERLVYMLSDAQAPLLLTHDRALYSLPGVSARIVNLDSDNATIARYPVTRPASVSAPDNLAYVIYTSGSTGKPKGVMVEHRGLCNLAQAQAALFGIDSTSRVLQFASLSFDASISELAMALSVGAAVHVPGVSGAVDDLAVRLQREAITAVTLPPAAIGLLEGKEFPALQTLIVAGEACSVEQARWGAARWRFINAYGPTEATVCASTFEFVAGDRVPIGRPLPNVSLYVLDEQLEPVPVGVIGELYIGGVGVARGYFGRSALTAQRFIPNPFGYSERLYRTGDRARYLASGDVEFLGRLDHQVKLRGYRIELGEIEAVVREYPGIAQAIVMMREDQPGDHRLVVYFTAQDPAESISTQELGEYLQERLPNYMLPTAFVLLESLPVTSSGKVDRRALPKPIAGAVDVDRVAPRTATEQALVSLWQEILGTANCSVLADFFALGGHSLLATRIIARVRDLFGVELPVRALFQAPRLCDFAAAIDLSRSEESRKRMPELILQERSGSLPLSFAQERLWFIEQLGLAGPAYTIPAAYRLRGELDRTALQRAFKDLVARHESLRTRFISVQGQPQQVIDAAGEFECEELDLSGLESQAQAQEQEVQRLVQEDVQRPFDLAQGPLVRVSLLRLGEQEHVLQMTMHHIVSDGWSTGVLMRDVSALYAAHLKGKASGLEPLAVQYADYAVWQRQWLQGAMLQEQLQYWKDRLSGAPAALELPTDHVRPAVASYQGGIVPFELESGLYAGLRELARQEGATLYMVLLAGFQVLLSRWSGQQDIVVGSPIAGRTQRELENLVGIFINTLLLRSQLQAGQSFRELLAQVKEAALGAYAHQDLPFEKLVAELQPQRDLSRQPLFQVGFAMQNVPHQDFEMAGLKLQHVSGKHVTSKLDLMLFAMESGAQLQCYFEYATDLFERSTIERMVGHFKTLLAAAVADPTTAVSRLPLLEAQERRQLLEEWNATAAPYPQERCLHEWISEQAARTPHAVALVCESQQLRYAQLEERSNQLGHYLRGLGVGPEVIVGLCVERSVEMVVGLLGILKAGGAYLPLDPGYPAERLIYMLSDAQAPLLLTQEKQQGVFGDYAGRIVRIDTDWSQIAAEPATAVGSTSTADNLAYVIYTSGSTGKPKGVMVEHRGLCNLAQAQAALFGIDSTSRVLQFASLSFDASISELAMALSVGAAVHVPGVSGAVDDLAVRLQREAITAVTLPPAAIGLLEGKEFPALQTLIVAGEACSVEQARWGAARWRFINAYGPTEATVCASTFEFVAGDRVPIGRPLPNVSLYVLDEQLEPVPVGVIGELYIGGVGVARGYFGRSALTAQRFIPNPFGYSERLYRTGDRARYLASGDVEFLGRLDHQVKLRGYRIELGEIEAVVREYPGVAQAIAMIRQLAPGDQRLIAYLETAHQAAFEESKLRAHLKSRLPGYMVPSILVAVQALPRLPNGKFDLAALATVETGMPAEFVAPRTPIEQALAEIWARVLKLERVGVTDDFFELGGHSLLATRIVAQVRELLAIELPLQSFFEAPTIAELADLIMQDTLAETG